MTAIKKNRGANIPVNPTFQYLPIQISVLPFDSLFVFILGHLWRQFFRRLCQLKQALFQVINNLLLVHIGIDHVRFAEDHAAARRPEYVGNH